MTGAGFRYSRAFGLGRTRQERQTLNTLLASMLEYYPNTVRVWDAKRPGVWIDFEVSWRGARFVKASCEAGENMRESAQHLAALAA